MSLGAFSGVPTQMSKNVPVSPENVNKLSKRCPKTFVGQFFYILRALTASIMGGGEAAAPYGGT